MAVLIEAISVVARSDAVLAAFDGDWQGFADAVPNRTLCTDGELVRVGFMTPTDVQRYIESLENKGLRYLQNEQAVDIIVVDQIRGPVARCDWIEFGHVSLDGDAKKRVAACRLMNSTSMELFTPDGWE